MPVAEDAETVVVVYVAPGHQTDRELHSWGAAHRPLWDALRKRRRQVRGIGIAAENETVDRTAWVLRVWVSTDHRAGIDFWASTSAGTLSVADSRLCERNSWNRHRHETAISAIRVPAASNRIILPSYSTSRS